MYTNTYLFVPPRSVGEEAASQREAVIVEVSFDEACILAHGPYRGWEVFQKLSIGIVLPMPDGLAHFRRTEPLDDPYDPEDRGPRRVTVHEHGKLQRETPVFAGPNG